MTKKTRTTREAAEDLARAHTDMTIFGAVVEIMEGGHVSSDAQPDDFKIIAMAKAAGQRAFRRYEQADAILTTKPK